MATLPAFFRKTGSDGGNHETGPAPRPAAVRPERDPFQLRALPHEDVFFYCKKVDNSRLVREPDPRSRGACWSVIGTSCAGFVLLTGLLVPSVANTLAGYKLEGLRAEERRLLDERRTVEVREAELKSPQRLEQYAANQRLGVPKPGQVVRLDGRSEAAVAMVKK